ncbi:MAG TPA: (d)CMP kinase [Candidatus Marinimicrobia bacterium]|jgi:cytidylate kinase|nr:cytidylate kinase [Candidatus Neomarinimicrobiota bacterium]HBN45941.1 (d)CMP kinase [Candidatus Neomarinimicrobiota bacterium]HJL74333.1 (d)CMP kinase [Candidatus Neomarinimicrobiota bacterium]HJM70202.1 (d)CMP kinase [Candidatus Neomarinimicrobiota bacterium]|tara:strand:- start:7844 stop:8497 length:654 start_codon:yes stop_codon:yes gene_type:complete
MIIAIDGPAASGKSISAKIVAEQLGFTYLDTGAMYRCVTLAMINAGADISDSKHINALLDDLKIDLVNNDGQLQIMMNNTDVTDNIRTMEVTENVSAVSALKNVRDSMVKMQREIASKTNCVMEGRDIGTVVFPEAKYKFFLTSDVKERARRRQRDLLALGEKKSIEDLVEDIQRRDAYDSTRELSPLRKAEDAIEIDTTDLTIDGQVSKIIEIVNA